MGCNVRAAPNDWKGVIGLYVGWQCELVEMGCSQAAVTIAAMKVRIGISTTDKLLELEIDDAKAFQKEMAKAVSEGGLGWFTDSKGRTVGIPARSVAFIEMEDVEGERTIGFAPVD
ncbi:MAG TPA: DUF3107 family protein [Acidimicrobiia bacterium]|jgi:hypothetical protein|nr:DUF3107 family protein [Acidimicrobiia bacterium]